MERPHLTSQPSQTAVHRHSIAGIAADVGVSFSADGAIVVPAGSHLQDGDVKAGSAVDDARDDDDSNSIYRGARIGHGLLSGQHHTPKASSSSSRMHDDHNTNDGDDDESTSLLRSAGSISPKPRPWQPVCTSLRLLS